MTVILDDEGAKLLRSRIAALAHCASLVERIDCYCYSGKKLEDAQIELRAENSDLLERGKTKLLLRLSGDAIEYADHLLAGFLKTGYFFPAEFWSFSRSDRKYDTQVFFVKFDSTDAAV
ncbi:hypothetical protein [Variovorax boronicumulans]|uniref:hypothetical protein n=1 Tax=Variovorax boronicumulans TaxID=436515 RepID=UPI0033971402